VRPGGGGWWRAAGGGACAVRGGPLGIDEQADAILEGEIGKLGIAELPVEGLGHGTGRPRPVGLVLDVLPGDWPLHSPDPGGSGDHDPGRRRRSTRIPGSMVRHRYYG
jgi:hypothetical protein